jgi:hypothetical protein
MAADRTAVYRQGKIDPERTCAHCGDPIARRRFYRIPEIGEWVHATCEDAAVDPNRPPYR